MNRSWLPCKRSGQGYWIRATVGLPTIAANHFPLTQSGTESEQLPAEDIPDSFAQMQLDVFHGLWETYKDLDYRPRPESTPSKGFDRIIDLTDLSEVVAVRFGVLTR